MENIAHQTALAERRGRIARNARRMIWVKFQRENLIIRELASTSGVVQLVHRHNFHFTVGIQVFHNDREIEFSQFKSWLTESYTGGPLHLDHRSCELVSDEMYEIISTRYPGRDINITIAIDSENGVTIEYNTLIPLQQMKI